MRPLSKSVYTRVWCQQRAICAHEDLHVGLIFVAVATTFALGAESNRLPACNFYFLIKWFIFLAIGLTS